MSVVAPTIPAEPVLKMPDIPGKFSPASANPASSLSSATYIWNLENDSIAWEEGAEKIFGLPDTSGFSSGARYATLVDHASPTSRHAEIFETEKTDPGTGVAFNVRYLVNPAPGLRLWVEDRGHWFAAEGGRPRLVHGTCRRVMAPSAEEQALLNKKHFDPVTGALTRGDFVHAIAQGIETVIRDKRSLVLFLIRVDDLAILNRTYGFHIGDEIIAGVTRRVRGLVRRKDVIGRCGNNKIGVLLSPSHPEFMEQIAARLTSAIRTSPIETSAGAISASIRIGGIECPRFSKEADQALLGCEEALNDACDSPTKTFTAFSSDSVKETKRSSNRETTDVVLSALNDNRIVLAYQPIFSTKTSKIAMHEALVRMISPEGTWLGAGSVIPPAEKLGFLHLIDHRVMEQAVERLGNEPNLILTINVGVSTALHPEWRNALEGLLKDKPDIASRLVVEITETSLIEDIEATRKLIECIKAVGSRVAIDDFGAGHTSFRNMRLLPIDILKIDGTFIKNLARSPDDRFFVQTLLQLARHLKIETVAEWVQDEETANLLASWKVEYLQGDFLGKAHNGEPIKG